MDRHLFTPIRLDDLDLRQIRDRPAAIGDRRAPPGPDGDRTPPIIGIDRIDPHQGRGPIRRPGETLMRASILPVLAALAFSSLPAAAIADGGALTLYGGYRGGGSLTESTTGQSIDVKDSGAVSASLDLPIDANRQFQLFVGHQASKFAVGALPATPASGLDGRSFSVTYVHLGGTNFFDGPIGRGPYVVGGVGATLFSPTVSGYSSAWRPSLGVGVGYQWPVAPRVALRVEARGYVTLVDSQGSLFCSGGCIVSIRGDTFTQGEALVGLSVGF
jgi:hypothetical protein